MEKLLLISSSLLLARATTLFFSAGTYSPTMSPQKQRVLGLNYTGKINNPFISDMTQDTLTCLFLGKWRETEYEKD